MSVGMNVAAIAASLIKTSRYRARASRLSRGAAPDCSNGRKGVLPNVQWRHFPSSSRRDGCAIKKKLRSILSRADGVVIIHNEILAELDHHSGPLHKGGFAIFY